MRKLPWAGLGLVVAFASMNAVFAGCGSESEAIDDGSEAGTGTETGTGNETGTNLDASGNPDGFISTIDGGRADAASCTATGASCGKSSECCTANCNATTMKCEAPNTLCKLPNAACASGNECCTFSCIGGTCSSLQCVADNAACGNDNECCGGKCAPDGVGGGKCTPLGSKPTSGNPCNGNGDCASGFCNNGICANPSFCVQTGDVCSTAAECCGGLCNVAAGATLGLCAVASAPGAGNCLNAGVACTAKDPPEICGGSCCSKSCAPYAPTGVNVCQPESGCRVTGSICMGDNDCCGAPGAPGSNKNGPGGMPANVHCAKAPGATVGRCDNGNVCSPAGNICRLQTVECSTTATCCAGNVLQFDTCKQDALGIPRCTTVADYDCTASGPPPAGTACASTADCCGNPCVPNPAGGQPAFICGTPGACVPSGGSCSSTADCCAGLPCAITPGSTKGVCGGVVQPDGGVSQPPDGGGVVTMDGGTAGDGGVCALYGQQCTQLSDCCAGNGIQCIAGSNGLSTCRYP